MHPVDQWENGFYGLEQIILKQSALIRFIRFAILSYFDPHGKLLYKGAAHRNNCSNGATSAF
jgi:hypothetical protein